MTMLYLLIAPLITYTQIKRHKSASPSTQPESVRTSTYLYTVKPLYTVIRYNDKTRYNDNLNGTNT